MGPRYGHPLRALWEVLHKCPTGVRTPGHAYSPHDCWLYFLARGWSAPALRGVSHEGPLTRYAIEDVQFYWPTAASADPLPYVFCEVFERGYGNPHAYEWGPCRIRAGDHVIDAGACEGFFTLFAQRRGARVHAVEPVPELCQALERTVHLLNGETPAVVAGMLGRESGTSGLTFRVEDLCTAHRSEDHAACEVAEYALDDLVAEGRIPRVDFLKADVEGAELHVLEGAKASIARFRPRLSLAVYHSPGQAREVLDFCRANFEDYGWHLRGLYAWEAEPRPYMLYGWPERK